MSINMDQILNLQFFSIALGNIQVLKSKLDGFTLKDFEKKNKNI